MSRARVGQTAAEARASATNVGPAQEAPSWNLFDALRQVFFAPSGLNTATTLQYYWDVWVVASDTTAFGGGPKWTQVYVDTPGSKAGACQLLKLLPGLSTSTPDAGAFTLSSTWQFVKVHVVQKSLNQVSVVGTWTGYLPQVLEEMGCPFQYLSNGSAIPADSWSSVGQNAKIKLSGLPPVTFVWEMQVYNYQGLVGWSKFNWSPGNPQLIGTKAELCSTIKQLSVLNDNPAVRLYMKNKNGQLARSPWEGPVQNVVQQIGCG